MGVSPWLLVAAASAPNARRVPRSRRVRDSSEVEGSPPTVSAERCANVRAATEQRPYTVNVSTGGGGNEGGVPVVINGVHLRASPHQCPHDTRVAPVCRSHQWRHSRLVGDVHFCATPQQEPNYGQACPPDCVVQHRGPSPISNIDVRAALDEQSDDLSLVMQDGTHQCGIASPEAELRPEAGIDVFARIE